MGGFVLYAFYTSTSMLFLIILSFLGAISFTDKIIYYNTGI